LARAGIVIFEDRQTMKGTINDAARAAPRYIWLAEIILEAVKSGALKENSSLPPERDLAKQYQVSRDTVRKAIRYMQENGVIYSDHGRGNFVEPAIVRGMKRSIESFSGDTEKRGGTPGQRVLRVEAVPASMAIASLLNIAPGEELTRVHRVRLVDDRPVGLHDAHLVLPHGKSLTRTQIERSGSLYSLLKKLFSFSPAEAVESLRAAAAETEDAALLGVAEGSPLLVCERITFSDRREAVEYCVMKYVPSYQYTTRVNSGSISW
jgi:GntR family transcriptional regulator